LTPEQYLDKALHAAEAAKSKLTPLSKKLKISFLL